MANTLTTLQPVLFSAAQTVSAEPFGAVDAITSSFDDKGVAKGDVVKVPVAPTRAASDFTPANVSSTGSDATANDVEVQITKSRKVDWHLTGEQQRSLDNGATSQEWIRQLVAQGMRTLRNEAEADCIDAIYTGASRATGTAGTNPFASALTPLADVRKILRDNGAPMADLQFVGDTTSEANLLKLGVVLDASQAGSDEERRSGILRRQYGFEMRTSGQIEAHTKGTGTGYLLNDASSAIGDTTIAADTGSGTILAGDVVTFAGTADKYVVNTALAGGSFGIGNPGLLAAEADNDAITIGNDYTPNLAFDRSAVVGVMRPPVMPENPTIQQMLISDGMGMTYLMLDISQYGQRTWELHLAWGFKAVQSEHIAVLMG
jgi:hypothetical protein